MTDLPRSAKCPTCGKEIVLYKNGSFRRHGLGWDYGGGCDGSYKKYEQNSLNSPEPLPHINVDYPAVWALVMTDMQERDSLGIRKYGTRLQPFNGRNALVDAYQEALDLAVYLRQAIYEQTGA